MKLIGLENEQGSQEWLDKRKLSITASEMPIILGLSKWCTPVELWKRKLGFMGEQEDNFAMARGRELEPKVRDKVNKNYDYNFVPEVHISDDLDWCLASLDGIDEEKLAILEIKCCGKKDHDIAKKAQIPDHYYPQIQFQLFVTGALYCIYASFCNKGLVTVNVPRNDDYIAKTLLPAASEFYEYVTKMIEPPLGEEESILIDDEQFDHYAQIWKNAHEKAVSYAQQERNAKEKLISYTDDSNCHGSGISLRRINRSGSIDWNRLWSDMEKNYPDIAKDFSLESYKKEQIGYWKISEDNK